MIYEDEKNNQNTIEPGLYIVPTPIGNLEDITQRAMKILSSADIVACEDTRHSGSLLKSLKIHAKKLESYHEHNEESKSDFLLLELTAGKSIALISDAGMPGISDPGYRLINKAIENGIKIISLPGPTAFVPALIASGFANDRFLFAGFPPHKKGRKTFFEKLAGVDCTIIMYESPYRILKLLDDVGKYISEDRKICLAREISKIYEEYLRGTSTELKNLFTDSKQPKGEYVVIVEGSGA